MRMKNILHILRQRACRILGGSPFVSPFVVEQAEQVFYIQYLREGMIVFDVGANIGELTLLFSKFIGAQGKVHAFEASSGNFRRLETICTTSGRNNIVLNQTAVIDREDFVKLHIYDKDFSSWNSLARRPLYEYGIPVTPVGIEKVPAITIDLYCDAHHITQIDLLKIDVEGAEYQVLRGASNMLTQKKIGCCVFEFGATTFDMGNKPDEISVYLEQFGYRIRNIIRGEPVFPGGASAATARFAMHIATPTR